MCMLMVLQPNRFDYNSVCVSDERLWKFHIAFTYSVWLTAPTVGQLMNATVCLEVELRPHFGFWIRLLSDGFFNV